MRGVVKVRACVSAVTLATKQWGSRHLKRRSSPWVLGAFLVLLAGRSAWAIVTDLKDVEIVYDTEVEHADQDELRDLVASGQEHEAFEEAFELGDKLFGTVFDALDGGGANVGTGQRFTRVPRADLYFARDKMKLLRISGKSWTAITSSTSIGRLSNAQAGV
jgi:hypothetical protein